MADWKLTDCTDDARTLVTELVANAMLHAGTAFALQLSCHDGRLRIEVTDASPLMPRLDPQAATGHATGRGLLLVDELADRWGAELVSQGKSVWCELRFDRADASR